jgi:hypothetical protein
MATRKVLRVFFKNFQPHSSATTEAHRQVKTRRGERRSGLPHENATA